MAHELCDMAGSHLECVAGSQQQRLWLSVSPSWLSVSGFLRATGCLWMVSIMTHTYIMAEFLTMNMQMCMLLIQSCIHTHACNIHMHTQNYATLYMHPCIHTKVTSNCHWNLVFSALGMGLCVAFIALVRLPSLKVSTMLLVGLLIYDVFWVCIFQICIYIYVCVY